VLWGLLALGLLSALGVKCHLARPSDIRPPELAFDSVHAERGRLLIDRLQASHGGIDSWRSHRIALFQMQATWGFPFSLHAGWPENPQRFRLRTELGRDRAAVQLTHGPMTGRWFGDDGAYLWKRRVKDYWFGLPFRISEADVLLDAGSVDVDGVTYDRVFASWDDGSPSERYDQYLLYIDRDTGLLRFVVFTLRDVEPGLVSNARFDWYFEESGIQVPQLQTVRMGRRPGRGLWVHHNLYEWVCFGLDCVTEE